MQDAEGNQELPDRAEQYRVDTPQNETAAPVENAQADSAPTEVSPDANQAAQPVESTPAQTTEVTETQTVRETTAGTSDDS